MTSGQFGSDGGDRAGENIPVCPRHPDRISYVSCQRCGRPACPECQRAAAVGVQCVDCVKEQRNSARTPRTQFGGTVRSGQPIVTWVIIGLCVVVLILEYVLGRAFEFKFAYIPAATLAEPWRMLTASLLHDTSFLPHLLFNMYALWLLGQALEPALGRIRFLAVYVISALGSSVGVLLMAAPAGSGAWVTPVIGASGAIFGLFGALFVIFRRLGRSTKQILIIIGINAVLGFVVPNVAWQAHLGGLVTGALLGLVLAYAPKNRRRLFQVGGIVAVVVLLGVLTLIKVLATPAGFLPTSLMLG